jgi:hypothetical protein
MAQNGRVIDTRPLKDIARSLLPDDHPVRKYLLSLDDVVTTEEYLVIVKQASRLLS